MKAANKGYKEGFNNIFDGRIGAVVRVCGGFLHIFAAREVFGDIGKVL